MTGRRAPTGLAGSDWQWAGGSSNSWEAYGRGPRGGRWTGHPDEIRSPGASRVKLLLLLLSFGLTLYLVTEASSATGLFGAGLRGNLPPEGAPPLGDSPGSPEVLLSSMSVDRGWSIPPASPESGETPETGETPESGEAARASGGARIGTHTVQPGETLYGIANSYGVSVFELILANRIQDPTRIHPGQILRIGAAPAGRGEAGGIAPDRLPVSASRTSGFTPLEVDFSLDASLPEGTFMWDLGNWTFAFGSDPTYRFEDPGLYHVKLHVRTGGGISTSETGLTIRVYSKKTADDRRYITLSGPGEVLDLSRFIPPDDADGGDSRSASPTLTQTPVLFRQTAPRRLTPESGGYSRLSIVSEGGRRTLHAFVSPLPTRHAVERGFDWYKTQFGTGILGNCGPATLAMAGYWATGVDTSVASIRSEIGMPFSNGAINFEHMVLPLRKRNIQFLFRPISAAGDLMEVIDRGNIAIVLIHTSRIKKARGDRSATLFGRYYDDLTGHYVVVKGYSLDERYFVVYDPIPSDWTSNGIRYADGVSMLGKNRYYPVSQVMTALRRQKALEIYHN